MPRFQFPKAETRKTKHLQPLILRHNKTPIETHTHTRSSNKIFQREDSKCADLGYALSPIVGFGSVWPALSCLKFILFRKYLLIVLCTSLDYSSFSSSSSSSCFMMLLCMHATDEWVYFASLYQATFVLTSYL